MNRLMKITNHLGLSDVQGELIPVPVSQTEKKQEEFRNFEEDDTAKSTVAKFYKENHEKQTVAFVKGCLDKCCKFDGSIRYPIWEVMEELDKMVDESDPDTSNTQFAHAFQTAEAVRAKYPGEEMDWFHLVGFIHDIGKALCKFYDMPQYASVGDTNPVGCKFSEKIVFHRFFKKNPDYTNPKYNTKYGIYKPGCGFDKLMMSFGHDEYLYHFCHANKSSLPTEALCMIRYHSFYAAHKEREYHYFMNNEDRKNFYWLKEFNSFDLYSKADKIPDAKKLAPYYKKLIAKYFPPVCAW